MASDFANHMRIATELLIRAPIEGKTDHAFIGQALFVKGYTLEDILGMPQAKRWPETCDWLRTQFK